MGDAHQSILIGISVTGWMTIAHRPSFDHGTVDQHIHNIIQYIPISVQFRTQIHMCMYVCIYLFMYLFIYLFMYVCINNMNLLLQL